MSANDDLLEILKDAMGRVGTVTGRRMFGAVGVYFDSTFFALIDDGAVYLRASDSTRAMFVAEHSRPFSYMTKNGLTELQSYWRLPERLLDDMEELCDWLRSAVSAARDVIKCGRGPTGIRVSARSARTAKKKIPERRPPTKRH
jgi:DNA transformation protein